MNENWWQYVAPCIHNKLIMLLTPRAKAVAIAACAVVIVAIAYKLKKKIEEKFYGFNFYLFNWIFFLAIGSDVTAIAIKK